MRRLSFAQNAAVLIRDARGSPNLEPKEKFIQEYEKALLDFTGALADIQQGRIPAAEVKAGVNNSSFFSYTGSYSGVNGA